MATGVVLSTHRFLSSIFIPHRVHQSHCSSIFHRMLLTHTLALFANQFGKEKSPRICSHSVGFELTKLTYTSLKDNLIRHQGDRHVSRVELASVDNCAVNHMRRSSHELDIGGFVLYCIIFFLLGGRSRLAVECKCHLCGVENVYSAKGGL